MRVWKCLFVPFVCLLLLAGCAGRAPVPGGNDSTNEGFYKDPDDFKVRLSRLQIGMAEEEVFAQLGRYRTDFITLSRQEIVTALFGGGSLQVPGDPAAQNALLYNLQSLYGYKLEYKNVKRKLGFSSPIRVRTDESGFDYTAILIFQQGRLFEKPVISGGTVNDKSSKTVFDWLNPSMLF